MASAAAAAAAAAVVRAGEVVGDEALEGTAELLRSMEGCDLGVVDGVASWQAGVSRRQVELHEKITRALLGLQG